MKYIYKISILILLCSPNYGQQNFDYNDSLNIVWGLKNYSGHDDLNANCKIISDGEKLQIQVKVSDDIINFNSDPINSDHIELWFALPEILERYGYKSNYIETLTTSFIANDSILCLYDNNSNLDSLKNELKNPHINFVAQGEDTIYYVKDDEQWLQNDVDEFLEDLRSSNLREENIFFGLVHFGILPKSENVILYDTETYNIFQKMTHIELDDLTKYIKIKSKISETDYQINVEVLPEALGFVSKYGIKELRFMIDVVDVDLTSKQESLISTSQNRIWGNPKSFNNIKLAKPICVKLDENIKYIGDPAAKSKIAFQFFNLVPNTYVKSKNGWKPVTLSKLFYEAVNRPYYYFLPYISKYQFNLEQINYNSEFINNNLFEYFDFPDDQYTFINKKIILKSEDLISKIFLPNDSLALLTTGFSTTTWGDQITSYLYFKKINKQKTLLYYISDISMNPPSVFLGNNQFINKKWDYSKLKWNPYEGDPKIHWENVIKLSPNNLGIEIDLGLGVKYLINWNEKGEEITFSKIQ